MMKLFLEKSSDIHIFIFRWEPYMDLKHLSRTWRCCHRNIKWFLKCQNNQSLNLQDKNVKDVKRKKEGGECKINGFGSAGLN